MNNLLNQLNTTSTNLSYNPTQILVNTVTAFIFSFWIANLYKQTHRGTSYSVGFLQTIIMVGMIVAVVMMVIGNSLARAFGLVGAFSVIRFRTPIKETKDMAYIFLSLVFGMAAGTSNYLIGSIGLTIITLVVYFLTKTNFGSIKQSEYILSFILNAKKQTGKPYLTIFDEYLNEHILLNLRSLENGEKLELTFSIKLEDQNTINTFTTALDKDKDISSVTIISTKNDIEY